MRDGGRKGGIVPGVVPGSPAHLPYRGYPALGPDPAGWDYPLVRLCVHLFRVLLRVSRSGLADSVGSRRCDAGGSHCRRVLQCQTRPGWEKRAGIFARCTEVFAASEMGDRVAGSPVFGKKGASPFGRMVQAVFASCMRGRAGGMARRANPFAGTRETDGVCKIARRRAGEMEREAGAIGRHPRGNGAAPLPVPGAGFMGEIPEPTLDDERCGGSACDGFRSLAHPTRSAASPEIKLFARFIVRSSRGR